MGQSFGHFDAATNRDVLERLARGVRKGGRIVLDLWNREFFLAHQGTRELATTRGVVRETKRVDGRRLFVDLNYPDGSQERFDWELFTQLEMKHLAGSVGLTLLTTSTGIDLNTRLSPANPRLQFLLEC